MKHLIPNSEHPILIESNLNRIRVVVAGRVIADTTDALTLREAQYPAVQYIPRKDVDMKLLKRSNHKTYCPYKGDCSYYSLSAEVEKAENAVWSYENPFPAVEKIKDYLAFYPDRVEAISETNFA
jgi:uncharacterized protein (DUF427 family)